MRHTRVKLAAFLMPLVTGFATNAVAAPRVVTDIAPVHSLTAAVMGEVGAPDMLLRPGASPHGYAMAPSEARALAGADVVIWIGPALTPWLDRAIGTLAPDTQTVTLMKAKGVRTLPFREGALFDAHDHDHGDGDEHEDEHAAHDDGDEHHDDEEHGGHDDHDEHADHDEHHGDEEHGGHQEHGEEGDHADEDGHDDHAGHDDDGDDGGHDAHHGHGEQDDPHIWLDPRNAQAMARAIADALGDADPANQATYHENADRLIAALENTEAEMAKALIPAKGRPFIVFHDAYHYFEARFGVEAAGAIALSDAATPGPARLSEIRERLTSLDRPCVFAEPQFPEARARLVMEGTDARLAVLDPMGVDMTTGPDHYFGMLQALGASMVECLAE